MEIEMSDPRYTDPRTGQTPLRDERPRHPADDLEPAMERSSNAMWGWVAGGILLALVLVFVFSRTPSTDTASNSMTAPPPGPSTLSPPSAPPTPPTAQRPAPATTGQGASGQGGAPAGAPAGQGTSR
jgi:hypothetical protein